MSLPVTVIVEGEEWTRELLIGSGGFGRVYRARSDFSPGVIKLVPRDPGAELELLVADDLRGAENIFPVWGTGEAGTYWAILMPEAEKSLDAHLSRALTVVEALAILADVARALRGVHERGIIHRDLKPGNVLLYGGQWHLSDFGTARYIEATERFDTRKYSNTRPYAAPEQWRDKEVSPSTDMYAFGVLSYQLLTGSLPFPGPNYRDQHLHGHPPAITNVEPLLAALVQRCLLTEPGSRPNAREVASFLEARASTAWSGATSAVHDALGKASLSAITKHVEEDRQRSAAASEAERQHQLIQAAKLKFGHISAELLRVIASGAPVTDIGKRPYAREWEQEWDWELSLGAATLGLAAVVEGRVVPPPTYPKMLRFSVLAFSEIVVHQPEKEYLGRAHSLWYCDAEQRGQYAWYEIAFRGPRYKDGTVRQYDPISVRPVRLSNGAPDPDRSTYAIAWELTAIDLERMAEFVDRWATWFAEASQSQLERPNTPRAGNWDSDASETREPQVEAEPSDHKSVRAVPSALVVCIVLAAVAGVVAWIVHASNLQRPRYTASSPASAGTATQGTRTTTASPGTPSAVPPGTRVIPGGKTILVPSTIDPRLAGGGTDTGLSVRQGRRLIVTATGKAQYGAENTGDQISVFCSGQRGVAYTDPNGDVTVGSVDCNEKRFDKYCPLPNAPLGSLIARIGNGAWFLVGANYEATSSATGELWLGYNDSSPEGNSGSFTVTIST